MDFSDIEPKHVFLFVACLCAYFSIKFYVVLLRFQYLSRRFYRITSEKDELLAVWSVSRENINDEDLANKSIFIGHLPGNHALLSIFTEHYLPLLIGFVAFCLCVHAGLPDCFFASQN